MLGFLLGVAALCVVLVLPLLLLASLARAAFALVALPFRLLGLLLKLSLGAAGLLLKVAFGIVGLMLGLVLIPVLPLLLVGLALWGFAKVAAPAPVTVR